MDEKKKIIAEVVNFLQIFFKDNKKVNDIIVYAAVSNDLESLVACLDSISENADELKAGLKSIMKQESKE